jgi:polyferredoxin
MKLSQYHWKRRAVQFATLFLIALVPAAGLFRIDLTTATFSILGHEIWWSNFAFTFGLGIMVATAPIITYMTIGTVWCGWACPQNMLSEWANNMTHKFLGKRASVDVDESLQVAASKNKVINWGVLALIFLAAALALGIIPFLFFYPLAEAWGFITHTSSDSISAFMQRLYYFAVFLIFVDIAVVRHFFCDYACVYRIGQRIFKTQDALHVAYDSSRSADCAKCNYCAANCVTGIKPTNINVYDSCIDCGECIDACNRLHQKSSTHGLLSFELGEKGRNITVREKIKDVLSRFNWLVGAIFVLGFAMAGWGLATSAVEKPYVPTAAEQRTHQIAEQCQIQCTPQRSSCKGGSMAGCYRAAACQCQCQLDHDPSSTSAGEWRQCVQKSMENAEVAEKRAMVAGSGGTVAAP